jgi:hypothetical protein
MTRDLKWSGSSMYMRVRLNRRGRPQNGREATSALEAKRSSERNQCSVKGLRQCNEMIAYPVRITQLNHLARDAEEQLESV